MGFSQIDQLFHNYMNRDYFSGGVCYVSVDGKQVFQRAFGVANRETGTKVTEDTIFDIASVTKIITATIVLKAISEGTLSLSAKLGLFLPHLPRGSRLAQITIKQLLTHSSGLKAWHPFYAEQDGKDLFSILTKMKAFHSDTEKVVYSDLNFILLGEVLQHHFGDDLQTIVEREIKEPLGLESLTYRPENKENVAATEYGNRIEKEMCWKRGLSFSGWREDETAIVGEVNDGNAHYFFKGVSGHAGLFSNAADLARVGELYLKGGIQNGTLLIREPIIKEALKRHAENRGLGWEQSAIYPQGWGHTGFTGTAIWIEPERKIAAVLLTNRLHVKEPKNINPFRTEIFTAILSEVHNRQISG